MKLSNIVVILMFVLMGCALEFDPMPADTKCVTFPAEGAQPDANGVIVMTFDVDYTPDRLSFPGGRAPCHTVSMASSGRDYGVVSRARITLTGEACDVDPEPTTACIVPK